MTRTAWTSIAMSSAAALAALILLPAAAMGQDVTVESVVVGGAQPAQPAKPAPAAPGQEGPLSQVREELSAILKLAARDGKLALDRESWKAALGEEEKADEGAANVPPNLPAGALIGRRFGGVAGTDFGKLMAKVQAKCGSRSGGSSMSNTRYRGTFSGGSLDGSYTTDENLLELQLREQGVSPSLSLNFRSGENGTGIQLMDDAGDLVFILNQDANGGVSVVHVAGEQVFRFKAANYLALCKDRRDYVEKQLYPLLARVGVAMPLTPMSSPIRSAVLETLKGKPANFPELLVQLDSDKAATRDAATKALANAFLVCYKELKVALDDANSSAEVKARIQEIFKENRSKLEPAGIIQSMGLLSDKDLLEDMLKTAKTDEDRKVLTAALEKAKAAPASRPAK